MQALSVLAAGVNGASSGTAELYKRGTSTRATYFTDFEGSNQISSGADVVLDSNGGESIYVNEYVDVIVRSSNGTQVRAFTEGKASSALEVRSDSFTGTDYDDAETGASKPIALQEVLDKWNDSSGAPDWKVAVSGVATNLSSALSGSLVYFNVKDVAYGAEGDGTTDDTTAIQDAIDAAEVSGGTVFFPGGTYRITSGLTLTSAAGLLGASATTRINIDSSAASLLAVTGTAGGQALRVESLQFGASQSNSSDLISLGANALIGFYNCEFDGANVTGTLVNALSTSDEVTIVDSYLNYAGDITGVHLSGDNGRLTGCRIEPITNSYAGTAVDLDGEFAVISDCTFIHAAQTTAGATFNSVLSDINGANRQHRVVGCAFGQTLSLSATYAFIKVTTAVAGLGGANFSESGNNFFRDSNDEQHVYDTTVATGDTSNLAHVAFGTREVGGTGFFNETITGAGTVTMNTDTKLQYIDIQTTGAVTLDCELLHRGASLIVQVSNNAGAGTGTITWGSNFAVDSATFTIAADNDSRIFTFVCDVVFLSTGSTVVNWLMVNDTGDVSLV